MKTTPASIEKSIIQSIKPPEGASEDAVYHFRCSQTGRFFEIRRYDEAFYLDELTPIGLWDATKERRVFDELYQQVLAKALPNSFKAALQECLLRHEGINDPDEHRYQIIRSTTGPGKPIYLDSLSDCAAAISQSLNNDLYHVGRQAYAPPTEEDKINDAKQSIAYWRAELEMIASVEPKSVFSGTHLMTGIKISDEVKQNLLNYFNAPTAELWEKMFNNIIVGHRTLWQAWVAVDESAPRSRPENAAWPCIPGGDQLREALVYCVKSTKRESGSRLAQSEALLESLTKSSVSLSLVVNSVNDKNDDSDDRQSMT